MSPAAFMSLPIQGQGTAEVEALSSYLLRLAVLHAVAPGTLVRIMLDRLPARTLAVDRKAFLVPIAAFIRPNATTEGTVLALAASTGMPASQLECMTFLATKDALDRAQRAFSQHLRWCPACLREQQASGSPVYFKLAWQLQMVESCDIHGLRLRDTCAACAARQAGQWSRDRLDSCCRCAASLSQAPRLSDLSAHRYRQLPELIEHIATHPGIRFPKSGVARVLSSILDEAWRCHDEEHLYRLIPRDECLRFANPAEPITIQIALRIAFRHRVPVVALLQGDITGTNRPLLPCADEQLPRVIAPLPRGARARIEHVTPIISGAVKDAESGSPMSLKMLARTAGVSVGYLRYRFPAWVSRIAVCNGTTHRHAQAEIDRMIRAQVDEIEAELVGQRGGILSRKAALRRVISRSGLPKHRVRAEINARIAAPTSPDRDSREQ